MLTVLILAYDFPPYVSVGALRPAAWLRHLADSGVWPVVVTRQWGCAYGDARDYVAPGWSDADVVEELPWGTVVRAPYRPNLAGRMLLRHGPGRRALPRRAVTAFYEAAQFPLPIGPRAGLLRAARRWARGHRVDAVVATGEPFVLFKYARMLSRQLGVPWLADCRDPWTGSLARAGNPLRRWWERRFERRYLASAAGVVTVSEFFRRKIEGNAAGRPFHIIANGFDDAQARRLATLPQGAGALTVAFAGTVYPYHPLREALAAFDRFAAANPGARLALEFHGCNAAADIERLVADHFPALAGRVATLPKRPNAELLERLSRCNALLLFNDYYAIGTKIYDYLALGRKILLCFDDRAGDAALRSRRYPHRPEPGCSARLQAEALEATGAGVALADANQLEAELGRLWAELAATGRVACPSRDIGRYSRSAGAQRLAEIIKEVTASQRGIDDQRIRGLEG